MDEHQRRVWLRMTEEIEEYRAGRVTLERLTTNLKGLLAASDLRSPELGREFWSRFAPIDMELELRTEAWAPKGSPSDDVLSAAIDDFAGWVRDVLAKASP